MRIKFAATKAEEKRWCFGNLIDQTPLEPLTGAVLAVDFQFYVFQFAVVVSETVQLYANGRYGCD
jgi:hypothetical protein